MIRSTDGGALDALIVPDNSDFNRVVVKQKSTRTKSIYTANKYINGEFFVDDYDAANVRLVIKTTDGFQVLNGGTISTTESGNLLFNTPEGYNIVVGRRLANNTIQMNLQSPKMLLPPIIKFPNFISATASTAPVEIQVEAIRSGAMELDTTTYTWYYAESGVFYNTGSLVQLATSILSRDYSFFVVASDALGNESAPTFINMKRSSEILIDSNTDMQWAVEAAGSVDAPTELSLYDLGDGFEYEFKVIDYYNDFNADYSVVKDNGRVILSFNNPLFDSGKTYANGSASETGRVILQEDDIALFDTTLTIEVKLTVPSTGIYQYFYYTIGVDGTPVDESENFPDLQ